MKDGMTKVCEVMGCCINVAAQADRRYSERKEQS
jgi:hypothetical protein